MPHPQNISLAFDLLGFHSMEDFVVAQARREEQQQEARRREAQAPDRTQAGIIAEATRQLATLTVAAEVRHVVVLVASGSSPSFGEGLEMMHLTPSHYQVLFERYHAGALWRATRVS